MRIHAVRMREVGCFSAPVALEGLSGELDVLAGANELGKSTILKALQFLFTARHTAQSRSIERLRPYAGGAPLIEADFETDGRLWRLRKQFLSERHAVLTDVTAGKVAARGEEAHRRMLELIGGSGGEQRLGLLWLEQGMSLQPALPKGGEREQLNEVIEREVAAAAGGGHDLRAVREKVAQQRSALVTEHKPPRPKGDYALAIAGRAEAERSLEAARTQARAAADRLSQAEALRQRRAELSDPAATAALQTCIEKLRSDHDAALSARQQLKIAEAKAQASESRQAEAQQARDLLARQLEEVREIEVAASAGATAEQELKGALQALDGSLEEARSRRDDLRGSLDAARQQLRARQTFDSRREGAARLAETSARLAEAQSAARRAEEIRVRLGTDCVSEQRVALAESEAGAIATLEARITAQLPKVRIAYVAAGAGRMSIDGRPIGDGEVLIPSRPITIEIQGIGTISVDPAVSGIEEDQADLDAHQSVLADLLAAMGVPDLAAARLRLEERRRLERELAQTEDRVATRAPDGLSPLSEEVERLARLTEGGDGQGSDLPERPEIEAEIERLSLAVREAEQSADRLAQEHSRARESMARSMAAARAREERLAALTSTLPPPEMRAGQLAELEAKVQAVFAAVNEAVRERGAWREKAPDDAAMRVLEAELMEAQRRERSSAEELARVEKELAVIERDLERDRQEGIASEVKELEEKARSLDGQVRRFERELAALDLLLETLAEVEQQSRQLYLSPVVERLDPYVRHVFPGAKVAIGRDLGVETIERGAASESLAALSDGTQEQIAVLVRLAYARLLADAGQPTPLIIDDALVYSDDTRIEALFEALRQAASAHQVIVFTCRTRTFEQLGGHRLAVAPWAVS